MISFVSLFFASCLCPWFFGLTSFSLCVSPFLSDRLIQQSNQENAAPIQILRRIASSRTVIEEAVYQQTDLAHLIKLCHLIKRAERQARTKSLCQLIRYIAKKVPKLGGHTAELNSDRERESSDNDDGSQSSGGNDDGDEGQEVASAKEEKKDEEEPRASSNQSTNNAFLTPTRNRTAARSTSSRPSRRKKTKIEVSPKSFFVK